MALSHITSTEGELLAATLNFLDEDANASHLTMSPEQMLVAILNVVDAGANASLTMSPGQMLAGILNGLDEDANASHLTMSPEQMLAGIWNVLDDQANASHLTMSWAELLAGFANAAEGGLGASIVLSASSQTEGTAIGTTIGTLSVVGGSGVYTFTITADPDGAFTLTGADLKNEIVYDYEDQSSFSVTIEADNGVDTPISRVFTITVTDVLVEGSFILREDSGYVLRESGDRFERETF